MQKLSIWLLAPLMYGCSSHMYYEEAKVYGSAVTEELIRLGACPSAQACTSKQMVFWEGGGWKIGPFSGGGVSINVYRISEPKTAAALLERCRKIHQQLPTVPVTIVVYANHHIDNLNPGTPKIVLKERISK